MGNNLSIEQREYYDDRKAVMTSLRNDNKLPLAEIAKRFGISRERVRQIIGNTPYLHYSKTAKYRDYIMAHPEKTNDELARETGIASGTICTIRSKTRHAANKSSKIAVGMAWEELVSAKLAEQGIPNKLMPAHSKYNILAYDNVKIEVKASIREFNPPSLKNVSPTYSWNLQNHYPGKADIFVLVAGSIDNIFVIPAKVVEDRFKTMHCLRFAYPTSRPSMVFWQDFKDRYDLIERARLIQDYGLTEKP